MTNVSGRDSIGSILPGFWMALWSGHYDELTFVAWGAGGWKRDSLVFSVIILNRPELLLKEPDTNQKGGSDG
jgi:hypothetical protein